MELDYYSVLHLRDCKEQTHRQSTGRGFSRRNSHGWTLSHSVGTRDYRWHKRRVAKQERRIGRAIVQEYGVPETNVAPYWNPEGKELDFGVYRINGYSGDFMLITEYEYALVFEHVPGICCEICGKEWGH